MANNNLKLRRRIIEAGYKSIHQLIKVAEENIIEEEDEIPFDDEDGASRAQIKSLSADRLKNAAATKKLCINDAFEILKRIEEEEIDIESTENKSSVDLGEDEGFAEKRASR